MKNNETRRTPSVVVTEVELAEQGFTAEQERVLRMRTGARLADGARLGNKLDGLSGNAAVDVRARLRLIEAAAMAHLAGGSASTAAASSDEAPTTDIEAVADMVAALKSKKTP